MKGFNAAAFAKDLEKQVNQGLKKEVEKDMKRKFPLANNIKATVDLKSKKIIVNGLTEEQVDQLKNGK